MASNSQSFWLHYGCFMLHLAVITCDYAYINLPTHLIYAGRFKFLTFWSFLIGLFYHNLAAIFDFLVYARERDNGIWRSIRDYAFTVIVFPLSMFVCSMFWILYTANPTFMRTPEEDKLCPFWMNHGYHTLPIVVCFIQAFVIQHTYPRKLFALIGLILFIALYVGWLLWIAHHANFWVYPFMAKMSNFGVFMFVMASALLVFGLYFIGKTFSEFVWSIRKPKSE